MERQHSTYVWFMWLATAILSCSLTYNPIYLALMMLTAIAMSTILGIRFWGFLKVGLALSLMPLVLNTFFVHLGGHTLAVIPARITLFGFNIPLLLVSGRITLEAVSFGIIMSLILVNMVLFFGVFNTIIAPESLLRIIPSRLNQSALLASIAMRFTPTVIEDYHGISDAQKSRGVVLERGSLLERTRNNVAIITPVLVNSLERSYNLAESMASRAYSADRKTYRREHISGKDAAVMLFLAAGAVVLIYSKLSGLLDYWPYSSLEIPGISGIVLIGVFLLSSPAWLNNKRGAGDEL